MTIKNLDDVCNIIESESFEYAIVDYSDFEDIKDVEFHRPRNEFIRARNQLRFYLESQTGHSFY